MLDYTLFFLLLDGLVVGCLYALVSIPFAMIFGVMNVPNLAHGAFVVLGSYLFFSFFTVLQINPFISLIIVTAICALIGMGFNDFVIKPVRKSEWTTLVLFVIIAILMEHSMLAIWQAKSWATQPMIDVVLTFGSYNVSVQRLIIVMISAVSLLLFGIFIKKTKAGKAMRFVAQNLNVAMLSGVNPEKIYRITVAVAFAFAACGGCLLAPVFGVFASLEWVYLGKAFAIVIAGGLGSFKGTAAVSFLLGMAEVLFGFYVSAGYKDLLYLSVILIVLIFRPYGLFGKGVERA